MKAYVFGNRSVPEDVGAIEVAEGLEGTMEGVSFVFVGANEDGPFVDEGGFARARACPAFRRISRNSAARESPEDFPSRAAKGGMANT